MSPIRRRGGGWLPSDLQRPDEGRLVAGVCAALGDWLRMDVTLIRLAFLLLGLAHGLGVLLYVVLWILVPGRAGGSRSLWERVPEGLAEVGQDLRDAVRRTSGAWDSDEITRWPRPLTRRWIAVGLIAGGVLIFLSSLGLFSWLGMWRIIGLVAVLLGAALLFNLARGGSH